MLLVVLQPCHGKVPQLPRQFCEKKKQTKKKFPEAGRATSYHLFLFTLIYVIPPSRELFSFINYEPWIIFPVGNQTTHVHLLSVVASSFYPGLNSELNCLRVLPLQATLLPLQMVGLHTSGTFFTLTFAINAELMHWARHAQLIRLTLMKNFVGMTPMPFVTLQRNFLSVFILLSLH